MKSAALHWRITVFDEAGKHRLFHGMTLDAGELEAVAAEAARLRPEAQIFIKPPMGGKTYRYGATNG